VQVVHVLNPWHAGHCPGPSADPWQVVEVSGVGTHAYPVFVMQNVQAEFGY